MFISRIRAYLLTDVKQAFYIMIWPIFPLFSLILVLVPGFAQFPPLNFYKITNDEGLSQASVNVVFKDKAGFLWVGTDDGLNRFDGKKIKSYVAISFKTKCTRARDATKK